MAGVGALTSWLSRFTYPVKLVARHILLYLNEGFCGGHGKARADFHPQKLTEYLSDTVSCTAYKYIAVPLFTYYAYQADTVKPRRGRGCCKQGLSRAKKAQAMAALYVA